MKYTNNYHLPQWSEDDLILMDDFNKAMANMENGIDGAKAEAKADAAEAQAIANSAKTTANAAKTAADAALAAKPYVTGRYTGALNGVTVRLGFRPSFVIVSGMEASGASNVTSTFDRYFGMTGGNVLKGRLDLTDTGFTVYGVTMTILPYLSEAGRVYDYIAFK